MKVAIIPARGGSKRISRKNIRLFLGRPILSYSISAAQKTGLFDRIIVSTDDREIAEVARQYGAQCPFLRPAELSGDFIGINEVMRHAMGWLNDQGESVDFACCIFATAPLIQASYLEEGFRYLVEHPELAFAFSVTSFPFPIQRGLRLTASGTVTAIWPEHRSTRSQDLEETFHDAGQFYWGRSQAFLDDIPLFSPASKGIVLPRYLVQDIDTEEDWLRAEFMYQAIQGARVSSERK